MPVARPCKARRGAALLIVLATVMLVGTLVAAGGARRYTLLAEQKRATARARLRVALWDAVWSDLRTVSPKGLPSGGKHESPDGIQTSVDIQPAEAGAGARLKDSSRFTLTAVAALGKERHEAWALARKTGDGIRILTWVER